MSSKSSLAAGGSVFQNDEPTLIKSAAPSKICLSLLPAHLLNQSLRVDLLLSLSACISLVDDPTSIPSMVNPHPLHHTLWFSLLRIALF